MSETSEPPPQTAAPKASSKTPLIAVILVVIVGGGAWYFFGSQQFKVREFQGDVTYVDYASRKAEMELPDPKGGTPMTVSGDIPMDCKITVDGKPGSITDIAVGDRVRVTAKYETRRGPNGEKERHFTPVTVEVLRKDS